MFLKTFYLCTKIITICFNNSVPAAASLKYGFRWKKTLISTRDKWTQSNWKLTVWGQLVASMTPNKPDICGRNLRLLPVSSSILGCNFLCPRPQKACLNPPEVKDDLVPWPVDVTKKTRSLRKQAVLPQTSYGVRTGAWKLRLAAQSLADAERRRSQNLVTFDEVWNGRYGEHRVGQEVQGDHQDPEQAGPAEQEQAAAGLGQRSGCSRQVGNKEVLLDFWCCQFLICQSISHLF